MGETRDVTVRIGAELFDSDAEAAGWVHGAVRRAMVDRGWEGEPVVLFRSVAAGAVVAFGLVDGPELPHGLVEGRP